MTKQSIDNLFEKAGLVDIQRLDASIVAWLKYATADNFVGKVLYHEKFGIYAEPRLAHAVAKVSGDLHRLYPGYNLVVLDAARPVSVQKEMFDLVAGTPYERYIADPYSRWKGGFHNFGMAVDISIADNNGDLLDMGSGFDEFCELSHVGSEYRLFMEGKLSAEAYKNRMLLYALTSANSLMPYPYEWWHYQIDLDEDAKLSFELLDF